MPRLAAATYEPVRTYKCVQGVERWPPASGWPAEAAAPHQTAWRAGQQHTDKEPAPLSAGEAAAASREQ